MRFAKAWLFLMAVQCSVCAVQAQAPKDFHLRNAYEVSKWLYKAQLPNAKIEDSLKQQLLGSLIWYANLQDVTGNVLGELEDKLKKYPYLDSIKKKLSDSLVRLEQFFLLKESDIQSYLPASVNSALRNEVIQKKQLFDRSINQFKIDERLFNKKQNDSSKLFNEINQEKDDEIKRNNQLIEEKEAVKKKFQESNNTEEVLKCQVYIDSVVASRDTKTKELQEQIDRVNKHIVSDKKEYDVKKNSIDSLRSNIINFLLNKEGDLKGFALYMSSLQLGQQGVQTVSAENAFAAFTAKNLPEMQQVISELETASRLAIKLPTEAEMINALAIYLANRIKQESVMWFFEKITQNANRYDLLNLFFPTTMKLLQGNEVYEVPNLGAQWRYALSKDFMQMPKSVLTSKWLSDRWPEAKQYSPYILGTCDLAELIVKRYSYRDAIKSMYLANPPQSDTAKSDTFLFQDYISFLYAINTELFVPDTSANFRMLTYEDYRNMNGKEIEIMLSLMDLKYQAVFSKLIKGVKANVPHTLDVERVRRMLGNIRSAIGQVEKVGAEYLEEQKRLQQNGQKDWFYSTYNVWGSLNQIFGVLSNLDTNLINNKVTNQTKKVFFYGEQVFEIYNLVTKKNFAGAVMNTLSLIDTLFYEYKDDHKFTVALKDIQNDSLFSSTVLKYTIQSNINDSGNIKQFHYKIEGDSVRFEKTSPLASILFENERHAIQLIRKLSGFLNDAALAQNDKQLAKVVESYAMPVGSYKKKRNNWWSVDLNAFAGPYGGYEWSRRQKNDTIRANNSKDGYVWGVSVPIGISLSKTFGRKWKSGKREFDLYKGVMPDDYVRNPDKIKVKRNNIYNRTNWTMTLTASIVDLGAIVSYRLGNSNDTTVNQTLKWSQFLSPGLHLAVGLPGSPFVISSGIQYTPQLRKYEEAGKVNEKQFNTTRIYLGLMFDLPLFNFWERKHIVYRKEK